MTKNGISTQDTEFLFGSHYMEIIKFDVSVIFISFHASFLFFSFVKEPNVPVRTALPATKINRFTFNNNNSLTN